MVRNQNDLKSVPEEPYGTILMSVTLVYNSLFKFKYIEVFSLVNSFVCMIPVSKIQ